MTSFTRTREREASSLTREWDRHWQKRRHEDPYEKRDKFRYHSALELMPPETRSLLDVGGGDGTFALLARERLPRCEITVIDSSSVGASLAEARGFSACVGDIDGARLPFPDDSFDVVTTIDVLEHILAPWGLLQEVARVSKRWIIVSCPNFASPINRWDLLRGRPPRTTEYRTHIRFTTFREVRSWLEEAGFRADDYRTQIKIPRSLLPVRRPKPSFMHRLSPNLATRFTILAHLPNHADEGRRPRAPVE
jgi:methionine biosynthesis protein MetW